MMCQGVIALKKGREEEKQEKRKKKKTGASRKIVKGEKGEKT